MTKDSIIDHKRIDEIQMRLAATTPGPWLAFIEGRNHESGSSFIETKGGGIELDGASNADIDFIASAHQDIPYLIEELQRLVLIIAKQD